jgi:hypothetical protein
MMRYNRAEGLFAGVGSLVRPLTGVVVRAQVGYAFARGHLAGSLRIGGSEPGAAPDLLLHANQLRDLGPIPGAAGLVNSLSAAAGGPDYLDPFFATGARVSLPVRRDLALFTASLSVEQHHSATVAVANEAGLRPVRPVEEGIRSTLSTRAEIAPVGSSWRLVGHVTAAAFERRRYLTLGLESAWNRDAAWKDLGIGITAQAGAVTSEAPPQELFLLGGRETLLGHPYREFVGDRFWWARAHVSRTLFSPWLTGRAFVAAAQTALHGRALPPGWEGDGGAGVKATAGLGLGVAWDIVQIELGRGLDGGRWGLAVGASRRFRGWM